MVRQGLLQQGQTRRATIGKTLTKKRALGAGGSLDQPAGARRGPEHRGICGSDELEAPTRTRSLEHVGVDGDARCLRQLVQLHLLGAQHLLPPQRELLQGRGLQPAASRSHRNCQPDSARARPLSPPLQRPLLRVPLPTGPPGISIFTVICIERLLGVRQCQEWGMP